MQELMSHNTGGRCQMDREGIISPSKRTGPADPRVKEIADQSRCDFAGCFHEVRVSKSEWVALRKYACELDLNNGSYYDARIGAVCFWCGPENKPLDWPDVEIKKGTLRFPRDYVGAVRAAGLGRRKITLHFCIYAYARSQDTGVERMSPEYHRLLLGTTEDRKWVVRQFDLLRHHVALMGKESC